MPFPSSGCETCKIRRIKCDETQPVCRKCIRAHRVCRGMGSGPSSYVVHSENSYASGQHKRPRGPRSIRKTDGASSLATSSQPPPAGVDLKALAIAEYLKNHLVIPKETPSILRSTDGDLLPIWTAKGEHPILDHAVSAIALALFSRLHNYPPAVTEASLEYDRLLPIVRESMPTLDGGNIDSYLLAVFFMSRYEDAVHIPELSPANGSVESKCNKYTSFSHHDGALAVLKMWKEHLSHHQPVSNVIKHTRRGLIRSALLRKTALPECLINGAAFGERGIDLEYDNIVVRLVHVRERLAVLLKHAGAGEINCHARTTALEALDSETQSIDKALQDMTTHFPSTWSYKRHTRPVSTHSYPTQDFFQSVVYSYSNVMYAGVWNLYFATRMLINNTRLDILETTKFTPYDQTLGCSSVLNSIANDLASSLPYCFGKFRVIQTQNSLEDVVAEVEGANFEFNVVRTAAWPLTIASGLGYLDQEQKSWFQALLLRIGKLSGFGSLESVGSRGGLNL
ncbi:hypothetical protein BGW36DRAFT_376526 [Talaromyces proteolyticus]|uniref:Zn(2)-C6 fungal-type domain-containing protein n=1 Tax=Talaromyces proteolyticus TaxID=1131652 RepID=A0AAD4Q1K3_9EURO|nr:uncharacterized protein BGW36DRAFT_376526 [Talaromyces proteolyticus]KAH8698638.1 hypothetical protein BGW36DRAFT_376526 [Talaromyces proteolyticus]